MITDRKPVVKYLGSDSQSDYTFPFKILSLDQIQVLIFVTNTNELILQEFGNNLSSGLIDEIVFDSINGGGTVKLADDLPVGQTLILKLGMYDMPQPFRFREQQDFKLREIENAFDFVNAHIARLYETTRRKFGLSDKTPKTYDFDVLPQVFENDNETDMMPVPNGIPIFDEDGEKLLIKSSNQIVAEAIAEGGSGLPLGGEQYALVEKQSADVGDAVWTEPLTAVGFSARFGTNVNLLGIKAIIDWIMNIQYQAPGVSFGASSAAASLREKGVAVTATTLTANITKNSSPITEVRFYRNPSTLLDTQTSGGAIPNGGSNSYNWTGSFSDNTTFRVEVDDGTSTVTQTVTFPFVYPYYMDAGVPGKTAAQVGALTKVVQNAQTSYIKTFAAAGGDVFYFAYPATISDLTSILDVNNFETLSSWTKTTANITGLDGTPQSYKIYAFNNTVTAGSYQYTFKR